MRKHGGRRKGAGRPRKDSPLGCLRALETGKTEAAIERAAQGLMHFRWDSKARKGFRRSAGVDYIALRVKTLDRLWDALLVGLPKMAERGDVAHAWFAYRMITRKRYGTLRPRPEVLAQVRELLPQAGRALWRISVLDDPKHPVYKSTSLLKIRRRARAALCKHVGVSLTRELVRAPGREFTTLLLRSITGSRPTLSPEQAVVLAAWADRDQGVRFLKRGLELGMFRIRRGDGA